MKLVIDIPEEDYEGLKKKDKFNDMYLNHYEKLIVHGTPLPKGHGRLIDADKIAYYRCPNNVLDCPQSYDFTCQHCDFGIATKFKTDSIPTIIEADKVESEDTE